MDESVKILINFFKSKQCEENIFFAIDYNRLRYLHKNKNENEKEIVNLNRLIFKKYITENCIHELNLDSGVISNIKYNYNIKKFKNIYDVAYENVIYMINSNITPLFIVKYPQYKSLFYK